MSASPALRVRAFAKINLTLRVIGTRPDGYHELRTTFQSLALHDTLSIARERGPFTLIGDGEPCPLDATNLVVRAAHEAWRAAGRRGAPAGVRVRLTKRIPLAAGLGGGSSDAAAALRAFGAIWRVPTAALRELAAGLGADVPYFFEGGTVLGLERGDLLFPLIDAPPAAVVLAIPDLGVSTREAFRWFDQRAARGLARMPDGSENDLQPAVVERHPEVADLVRSLARTGARRAAMTGSGSAVFGLYDSRAAAAAARERLRRRGIRTVLTRTLARSAFQARSRPELAQAP